MRTRPAILLTVALLVGFAVYKLAVYQVRRTSEWDIRETMFRYLFENNPSGGQQNVDYYFLSLGGKEDPPPEFLARFEGHSPEVQPVSAVTAGISGGMSHVVHGGVGIIISVSKIRWVNGHTVEVFGGYYAGLSSSALCTYLVERQDGKWVVIKNMGGVIS